MECKGFKNQQQTAPEHEYVCIYTILHTDIVVNIANVVS